ncbi:hypothetical protein [Rahnella sp. WP5]|uniref:hypothetical protein n=1 Tax=Rahnella sp. WP5 TaxID=1500266 RepID=UPI00055D201B|nr:hypothetical protein [Rahnella sp. WP5]
MIDKIKKIENINEIAYSFLQVNGIPVIKESFRESKENIIGQEYRVIYFKKISGEDVGIVISNNDLENLILKENFIKGRTLFSFIGFSTIIFLVITLIFFITNFFAGNFKVIVFLSPLVFGYFLYKMAYNTAGVYFKKLTDTITFLSASIAAAAVLGGINIGQMLYDDKENIAYKVLFFVILQSFSIFATAKFYISFDDTIKENIIYYQKDSISNDKQKGLGKIIAIFVSIYLFIKVTFHDSKKYRE